MPYCEQCGAHLKEGGKFCSKCGAVISERGTRSNQNRKHEEEVKAITTTVTMPPQSVVAKKKCKKVVLLVAAILVVAAFLAILLWPKIEKIEVADGRWVEEKYDSSGNCIKETYYDASGAVTGWQSNEYDDNMCSKTICYNADGDVESWSSFTYEPGGIVETAYTPENEVSWTCYRTIFAPDGGWRDTYYRANGTAFLELQYDENGRLEYRKVLHAFAPGRTSSLEVSRIRYEYDEGGRVLKEVWSDTDLNCFNITSILVELWDDTSVLDTFAEMIVTYVYDEAGNCIEYTREEDWDFDAQYKYSYDERGNCLQYTTYWAYNREEEYYLFEYDEFDNCIKATCVSEDGEVQSWRTYEYDAAGKCIRSTLYFSEGHFAQRVEYGYNAKGQLVREDYYSAADYDTQPEDAAFSFSLLYEYAPSGFCIKRTMLSETGSVTVHYGMFIVDPNEIRLHPEYLELNYRHLIADTYAIQVPDEDAEENEEPLFGTEVTKNGLKYEVHSDRVGVIGPVDYGLTEAVIADEIQGVPVTEIYYWAFEMCSNLKKVTIPNSVHTIIEEAFVACSSLEEINIPTSLSCIEAATFAGCSSLEEILIPNSVRKIETSAFRNCTSLSYVEMPSSVASIADNAFEGCPNVVFYCEKGSYAEDYAREHGIKCVLN